MKLLDGYIAKAVFFAVLVVLLIIVGLDAVFSFVAELEELEAEYQIFQALKYIALTMPGRIYEFIPIATLIGCLIGLGALANNSELTVIRASGVSVLRIVYAAVKPVLLFIVVALVLGQFVVPNTEQYAQSERARQIDGSDALSSRYGYWFRDDDAFVHINAIQPNGVLYGIARFNYQAQQLIASDYSERALFQGDHWVLFNVSETSFTTNRTNVKHLDTLRWNSDITPDFLSIVALKPDHLSITGLLSYARQLASQGLESGEYYFAFWKKVLQPFATVVMVFIAISFIFGPLRSVTMGQRITAGVVVGLCFNYAQELLGHVSIVFHVSPLIAAGIPIAICGVVGVLLLRRV
ncbi:MAG: LPS export ABC transporter permease LptG [Gammaproteobacteria bacterium]|nr:MAG: LPS export ABC transporter permease LptG [Gammaproteobacteria bacterium]